VLNNIAGRINLLRGTQDRLNSYCEAVNTAVGQSGVTPYDAYGELLRLRRQCTDERLPQFNLPEMTLWSSGDYQHKHAVVAGMQSRLTASGSLRDHPFRGSRIKILMPSEQQKLEELCLVAWQATGRLRDRAKNLADLLGLAIPQVRKDAEVLCRAARRAMEAPGLQGIQLRTGDWQARRDEIGNLLKAGLRLSQLHARFDEVLIPEAWDQDLLETRQHLINYGRKWWRFFSGDYRRARNRLAGLCRAEAPGEIEKKIELVDAVLEARRHQAIVRQHQSLGAYLFGAQWQGEKSDWSVLAKLFEWIIALYKDIGDGQLPEGILIFLAGNPRVEGLESVIAEVETALNVHLHHTREVAAALDLDENLRFGTEEMLEDQALEDQEKLFEDWSAALPRLHEIAAFNLQAETFQTEGLTELLRVIDSWPAAPRYLVSAFEWNVYEKLLTKAFLERPALAAFHGESHAQVVEQFRQLDRQVTEHNRLRLTYAHWQRLPQQDGSGQLGVLRRELVKRARHLPIRKLMQEAGNAIQAIKPVFMMSPLSIANYLAPDSVSFDLVIFDEASQVKPVDALGAILRGKQIVVVGDSKQMPPTSFFDSLIQGGDGDDENGSVTADIESILGLCKAQGMPERMLRWHYRSRHESLIAVSNYEFYENRLIVFPGVDQENKALGLVYHHLPHTVYDRGRSTTNAQEASIVAQAVMEFARAQLHLPVEERQSLLAAAFSVAQATAIWDRLEMLRRQDTSCEGFFAKGQHEPFDVKNLENVQGDERDVIFISIGYGRDETGQVSMNFGPLNRDGGERRLNVLITRARKRCEVFTNLTDQDIDLNRTNSRGVRVLKSFLAYARTGKLDIPVPTGRGTDSPFEDEVKAALESLGYEIKTQVGTAGFFIDLAVVDPKRPGSYLLGIECDGAMYHSSRSARDRDRLRQQVLEGLGWRIHRIWSTDWFRHAERELKRVVAAIQEAQTHGLTNTAANAANNSRGNSTPFERTVVEFDSLSESNHLSQPYQMADFSINLQGYELHTVRRDLLASWVVEVVKIEGPVHINEVARRIANAAEQSRVGSRIKAAIESACNHAVRAGAIRQQGDFLWMKGMNRPVVRDRSYLPTASRKIELVAPEELAVAIEQVVRNSFGIQRESVGLEVIRILGFSRTSDEMRYAVETMIDRLLANGGLKQAGSHIVVSSAA
jgi:very-short-patch-repair endonuclease